MTAATLPHQRPPITRYVIGTPWPQGSKSAVPRKGGGRPIVIEGNNAKARTNLAEWRSAVRWTFAAAVEELGSPAPWDGPVGLVLEFLMPKGSSLPRWKRWADRKPDGDKLLRSTMDALTMAGVYTEDSRVVDVHVRKLYAIDRPPGAWVRVWGVDPRSELVPWESRSWGL